MASNYLDLVKAKALDVMLQKEPTSKLLRGYLREALGLTNLPVLTTWEEWEEWLKSQPLEQSSPAPSPNKTHSSNNDWEDLIPNVDVTATVELWYEVKGTFSHTYAFEYDLSELLNKFANEVEDTLQQIRACETVEEVENLHLPTVAEDLIEAIELYVREEADECGVEYDSGDINIYNEYLEDEAMYTSELRESIIDFVRAYASYWKEQLEENKEVELSSTPS